MSNDTRIFYNIHRIVIGIKEDFDTTGFYAKIIKRSLKRKILKVLKKIKSGKFDLNWFILEDYANFCVGSKCVDCVMKDGLAKITIPQSEKYGPITIRFNMETGDIILQSYCRLPDGNHRISKEYKNIIAEEDDTYDIIDYIKLFMYQSVYDYAKKELS